MKSASRIFAGLIALFAFIGLVLVFTNTNLAAQSSDEELKINSLVTVKSSEPVTPVLSPRVIDLVPTDDGPRIYKEINPLRNPGLHEPDFGLTGTDTQKQDPLVTNNLNSGNTPTPLFDFEGLGTDGFTPPDTVGEVGPNHYIQMVNISFSIFDKTGTTVVADTPFTNLFTGSGLTACENENDGDPIVVYDDLADRWLLSQFAVSSGTRMCIAISQTADPTGAYYLYQFDMPDFPDYFKFGVWPDAYYMGTNTGFPNQYYAYAFDRAAMLSGSPATFQFSNGHPNFMMPADLDGSNAPPAGSPGYFYTMFSDGYPDHPPGVDRIALYEFDVDWATPANTTYAIAQEIPIAAYNYTVCGFFVGNCIPQPGTAQGLDSLSYWPMFRFAYRNLSAYQAMVGNFTVDVDGSDFAGIRWFELQKDGPGAWTLHQEGTHADLNSDGVHRWMGGIAMDGSGNIALGYSASSSAAMPSIRYATRLRNDPTGTFQNEVTALTSTGVHTGIHRWGDYSGMSIDPADDCTFWYTNQYDSFDNTGFDWQTRVVVFRIPECSGSIGEDFTLSAAPDNFSICSPATAVSDLTLSYLEGFDRAVNLSAVNVPAGTTANIHPSTVISPATSSTLTLTVSGTSTGAYDIDIVGMASPTPTHTTTVSLDVFNAAPGAPILVNPADLAVDIDITPTFTWTNSGDAATSYFLELSDSIDFSNIIYTTTTSSTSHDLPGANALNFDTWYYWRVTASNVCGSGTTSAEFAFKTAEQPAILCATPALSIPDNDPTGVTDVMNVTAMGNIVDMDITLDTTHTWVGDLKFDITHDGNTVSIFDRPGVPASTFGCSGNDILATINDEGVDGNVEDECGAGTPTIAGDFVGGDPPSTSLLSIFDGGDVNGDWTITVSDNAGGDTGTLNEWCLVPTIDSSGSGVQLSADMAGSGEAGATVDYTLTITNSGGLTDTFDLTVDPEEWPTALSTSSVTLNPGESTTFTASVTIPGGATNGDEGMSLVIATSQSDPNVDDDAWLTTTAVTYGVMLSADQSDSGNVGSTVTYTVHITNTGGLSDTFDLSASGVWTTTSSLSSISLDVGESESFEVTVAIPADAPNGTMDVATVTASAQSAPSVTDESLLTTTAVGGIDPDYYIYLPLVLNAPE